MRRNRQRRQDRAAQSGGMLDLVRAEGAHRAPARAPASFVSDRSHDRRRDPDRRETIDRMLASLDADERAAYLRSIRGQAKGATVR